MPKHKLHTVLILLFASFWTWQVSAQPVIAPSKGAKYNLQIDARKSHFSGMVIARPTANGPRVLATSYFGPTIFDFTLADTLKVNSCVEPMRRPKVIQLLERDLRVVFADRNLAKLKSQTSTEEKRKLGCGLGKSVFVVTTDENGNITQILVKHPWIRLRLTLEKI